ncbi:MULTISPECIES: 3'-5' exoribonuclease [unclassified Streptomyces]|uniref:3'-5' exoribonuclease n=1 Tax=unclassified Streptomyces TaxID=2593676 RepID=UPI0014898130|nr:MULTISPECIES: 3'-5' exoribonuclease [unclassified Streptomyces]
MRIFYDTEFLEDGQTIELISIGLVAEDGREYYAVSRRLTARTWRGWQLRRRIRKHPWLMENVVPHLPQPHGDFRNHMPKAWLFNYLDPAVKRHKRIAADVAAFIQATPDPQLWAWYGAYDHVALAQLFGRMIDLPEGVPMWTNDLRQECERLGNPELPAQIGGVHNALADARHNLTRARFMDEIARNR